jgi:glucose/arabinose dehydrogenase
MSSISRATTLLILALVCGLLAPVGAVADFSGFPGGDFADQPVVSADEMRLAEGSDPQPTSIAWLPDGDLLVITQQGGLFRDDGSSVVELLDLSQDICSFRDSTDRGEMGLLGLAVDPNFNDTGNIFLYYTDRKTGNRCANRVARYRIEDEQAELVDILVDNIRAPGNHNAGDLQFGRDKLLYISVGDGGTDFRTGKPQDENGNARRLDLLNGKILRITAEGAIPAGNPFQGPRTGRCHTAGQLEQQG